MQTLLNIKGEVERLYLVSSQRARFACIINIPPRNCKDINKITVGWRKLHNEEFYNLYSSPNIIRMLESRRMRLAGHVAREEANLYA
jgi:hypothetical protein